MTADVKNWHGGESLHLHILDCLHWSINLTLNTIMKATRSDQVKQTHFYIDVINVHRLLTRLS